MIHEYLPYAQFIAQIALVAGAIFAGYQFLMHRRERTEHAALEVLTQLESTEFLRAYARIWDLPVAATVDDVRAGGAGMKEAADRIAMTFEVLGVMVHNRIVPIELVDQVIGGFLRESWRRLGPYFVWRRQEVGSRRVAEWYQRLAERLSVDQRRGPGAYELYAGWRP